MFSHLHLMQFTRDVLNGIDAGMILQMSGSWRTPKHPAALVSPSSLAVGKKSWLGESGDLGLHPSSVLNLPNGLWECGKTFPESWMGKDRPCWGAGVRRVPVRPIGMRITEGLSQQTRRPVAGPPCVISLRSNKTAQATLCVFSVCNSILFTVLDLVSGER